MLNLSNFNPNDPKHNDNSGDFVPSGTYDAFICETSVNQTKSGDGEYLKVVLEITGPASVGRKVFRNLNLSNPNQIAVQIAEAELASICKATGVLRPQDATDFLNKTCQIKLSNYTNKRGEEQQRVKYFAAGTHQPAVTQQAQVAAPPSPTPAAQPQPTAAYAPAPPPQSPTTLTQPPAGVQQAAPGPRPWEGGQGA